MHENLLLKKDNTSLNTCLKAWISLFVLTVCMISGCQNKWEKEKKHAIESDSIRGQFVSIADSINYGVEVKTREKSDKWQKKWLSNFERKELVDFIFEAVYDGQLQPYEYFNDKPMSIEQVKQLEQKEEFDRSKIGKIQFKERWYFDPENLQMIKEVHSLMFAYEVYKDDGNFRGYKPAFKVYLNKMIEQ